MVVTGATQITSEEETTILLGLKAIMDTLPTNHYRRRLAADLYINLTSDTWLYKTNSEPTPSTSNDA